MYAMNFFRSVILLSPDDLLYCLYICLCDVIYELVTLITKVAPSYKGYKFGVGDSLLIQTIANSTGFLIYISLFLLGRKKDTVKDQISDEGDLGCVAEKSKLKQSTLVKPKKLTVKEVFDVFKELTQMSGHKVNNRKSGKIQSLYTNCSGIESRYLFRYLQKNLRIGLREPLILNALAQAFVLLNKHGINLLQLPEELSQDVKTATSNLRNAYCFLPNLDILIPLISEKGWREFLAHCSIQVGMPVKPMLAIPLNDLSDVYKRFTVEDSQASTILLEYKYDGERAQIHYDQTESVTIFSRNQENITSKYPDLVALCSKIFNDECDIRSFIIDSEIVAVDKDTLAIKSFQTLMTRKSKNVTLENIQVHICVMAFDLLHLNGKDTINLPLMERKNILRANFKEVNAKFQFARNAQVSKVDDENILRAIDEAVDNYCEGLMLKDFDSPYQINKRSPHWIKLKKDYIDKCGDTLDLIVMGAYYGAGKRTGTYGGYLMGCYDPISESVQSICKIGTGLTDAVLVQHYKFFQEHITSEPPDIYHFDAHITPDNWFHPVQVWEIKASDMTLSNIYQAAKDIVEPGRGISLRFPRFIRIRDDKKYTDATESSTVAELYKKQAFIKKGKNETDILDDENPVAADEDVDV